MGKARGRMLLGVLFALAACSKESRDLEASQPMTTPSGPSDPRAVAFTGNAFQVSQGGRYFSWYGCSSCHGDDVTGPLDLGDRRWLHGNSIDQVYASIAGRHGRLGGQIQSEQLWQLSAYVQQLPSLAPERRRRQDNDQKGEPQGAQWGGPLR